MKILINASLFLLLFAGTLRAQFNKEEQIIVNAMLDQQQNSMDSLRLNSFPRPSFIQYAYMDGETNLLRYSRGALYEEELAKPVSLVRADIIVKDKDGFTNLNFNQKGFLTFPKMGDGIDAVPIRPDYDEIRRVLWWLSDRQYKTMINNYEAKLRKRGEPSLSENIKKSLELPDFYPLPPTNHYDTPAENTFDVKYWNSLLAEISGLYKTHEGLYDLTARVATVCGNIYTINTEGTLMRHAMTDISLTVKVVAENSNEHYFTENLIFGGSTAKDLPSKQDILAQTQEAIRLVLEVAEAETVEKEYFGPAIIDAPAVVNFHMFDSFTGSRITIANGGNNNNYNNDNLGVRLYSSNISMKATPALGEFGGRKLQGSYSIDADGIKPKDEFVLIENGILKQLLEDRTPTSPAGEPTGNSRYLPMNSISKSLVPGVLQITCSDTKPANELKSELIKTAKEDGLKYAFIVKRLKNGSTDWLYKVDVADGSETLVRGSKLDLNVNRPMRRILLASDNDEVFHHNYMGGENSVIAPEAFLLEEVNIRK